MGLSEKIALYALGVFFGALVYAMDWQREQDMKMSNLDKLIAKQQTLLDFQVKSNEELTQAVFPRLIRMPASTPVAAPKVTP